MHFVYDDAQIFIEFLLIDLEAINLPVSHSRDYYCTNCKQEKRIPNLDD